MKFYLKILITIFMLSHLLQAQEDVFHVVQIQGEVLLDSPNRETDSPLGLELWPNDELHTGGFSRAYLIDLKGSEIQCSAKTRLLASEPEEAQQFTLTKGGLRVSVAEKNEVLIKTVFALIKMGPGVSNIYLYRQFAIVETETGASTIQTSDNEVSLPPEHWLRLGASGVLKPAPGVYEKARAVFDFRDKKKDQALKKEVSPQENGQEKGLSKSDSPVDGKTPASEAKLVAGQAEGEGEYHYDSGSYFVLYAIGFFVLLSVVYFKWKKNRRESTAISNSSKKRKETEVIRDDVLIIRENLTAHHGELVTEKETHILGDVENDARIKAGHKLMIKGSFQGAHLVAEKDVLIFGGINGQGKAELVVAGNLQSSYISEASVLVKGRLDIDKAIRNSKVACGSEVHVSEKSIMGGTVSARDEINCPEIGSDFCETRILLGSDPEKIWKEEFSLGKEVVSESPLNEKARLRVYHEAVATTIEMGKRKHHLKKNTVGPFEVVADLTQPDKLKISGFKPGEGEGR